MTTTLNHHTVASLKMPTKMGDKIIKAQSIVAKMASNPTFPIAGWPSNIVSFVHLQTDVNTLVAAETAVQNKTGTAAARNAAMVIVMNDLRSVMTMVQLKADSDPANAITIIQNAGYTARQTHVKQKLINDAVNTQLTGTVLLTADGTGAHEWQMSKDQTTIISLPATTTSKTYVNNLTTGDIWYFRNHKLNTKKTTHNWCSWIKLTIGPGGKNAGGGNLPGHSGNIPSSSNL